MEYLDKEFNKIFKNPRRFYVCPICKKAEVCGAVNCADCQEDIDTDVSEENPYPSWTCTDCGKIHGNRIPEVATYHEGTCDVCGEEKSVTEPRDFGGFRNWEAKPKAAPKPTQAEKIEILDDFMDWGLLHPNNLKDSDWNPYKNWNHFAQLEERILADGKGELCKKYLAYFESKAHYISSDLYERCDAIISVIKT